MKTVTSEFKEEITKLGREIDFKFFLHTNDKILTEDGKFLMTEDNRHLVVEQFDDVEVDEIINAEDIYRVSIVNRGKLLSTMMKELDFEVSKDLRIGDVIGCNFGLKVNEDYEYIDYGNYMVYKKEFNEDTQTYSYKAYDRMLLTMQEVSQEFLDSLEGQTLATALNWICGIVGLSYNATQQELTDYPNLSKEINEGTFTGMQMTYRDVLDMIAQALGLSMIVDGIFLKLKPLIDNRVNPVPYTLKGNSTQNGIPTVEEPVEIINVTGEITHNDKTIDLGNIELCKIGNYQDYITKSTGKNLFNFRDTTSVGSAITVDDEGWITCTYNNTSGSSTAYVNYFTNNLDLQVNTNYNIMIEIKNVSGTGQLACPSQSGGSGQFKNNIKTQFSALQPNSVISIVKPTKDSFTGVTQGVRTYLQFDAGQSGSITFRISVLEDTTLTPSEFKYEPFGEVWYLRKEIGKIDSYNGETITTSYMSTTGELSNGATVYYGLLTNSTKEITDTTLVNQLEDAVMQTTKIDEQSLKDTNVSFGEKYMINSVVLSRSEDNDNIYRRDEESVAENGVHEYKIKDNLIMLYDDREDYIDEIFEQLNGLEYYINDFTSTGITYLDWLDFYNVEIGDKTYKCLMLNDEINIEQGLEESIYSEMPEETVTNYKTSSKTDKEVSFIVDKQNGKISGKVSQDDIIASLNVAVEDGQGIVELKGNSVIIDSDNFKLDTEGNAELSGKITSTEGTIGGFTLGLTSLSANVQDKYIYTLADAQRATAIANGQITPTQDDYEKLDVNHDGTIDKLDASEILRKYYGYESTQGSFSINNDDANEVIVFTGNGSQSVNTSIGIDRITTNSLTSKFINTVGGNTTIDDNGITTPTVTQTSKEENKKDFELLESGLQIIKNIDIYKYHLKTQEDDEKKHIGFVIGNDFNYSEEITSSNNDGVDTYSFISVCCKAIQEQQEQINSLKEEIKQLKESDK